jgi:16S rRNA (uracil1498-N3)-methyltransferase
MGSTWSFPSVKMHRFFLPNGALQVGQPVELTPLLHQLRLVLRLQAGAQLCLLDGQGSEFVVEVQQLDHRQARGLVLTQQPAQGEPPLSLTLYQCSLKADKFEWVLQKGTELGVTAFVPVISERSVVRPADALLKKYDRWQAILREAAEQCGRGMIPTLAPPLSWPTAVAQARGLRFIPWEEAESSDVRLQIADYLRVSAQERQAINLLIGPEGGITGAEIGAAQASGWQIVSLGPRILRAETAALVTVTLVMAYAGGFG